MTEHAAADGFIEKWGARWPEWRIAEVFVPASQRTLVLAWFALLQELTDAAWRGDDPAPGLAKLAWWGEELQGWSQGRRRHPLGVALQGRQVPWAAFALVLSALYESRTLPPDIDQAFMGLRPFAESATEIEAVLFGAESGEDGRGPGQQGGAWETVAASLVAMHPALAVDAHHVRHEAFLSRWPQPRGPRARRILATLARGRLAHGSSQPLSRWRTLSLAWHAARD